MAGFESGQTHESIELTRPINSPTFIPTTKIKSKNFRQEYRATGRFQTDALSVKVKRSSAGRNSKAGRVTGFFSRSTTLHLPPPWPVIHASSAAPVGARKQTEKPRASRASLPAAGADRSGNPLPGLRQCQLGVSGSSSGVSPSSRRTTKDPELGRVAVELRSCGELQGLCKQHGLPANRSNIDLARSLESLFRRTNFSPSQPEEGFDVLPFPEPKPKDQPKSFKETDKGFGREYITRKNSSKAGTYRRIACLKESAGQEKRDFQTANQLDNDIQVTKRVSDKALDRVANTVSSCPSSNAITEDVGCSTSGPSTSSLQHLFATGVQDTTTCHPLGLPCHGMFNRNGCDKISDLKNKYSSMQSPVVTRRRLCSLPLAASRIKKFGDCFPGSGSFPPHAISSTVPPAFQFFVESEVGINLFIDLSSSPSDWVKSLKDEVFISQESYSRKSMALRHEIRCLGDGNKNLKTPLTEITGTETQQKGSGGSTGCVNSSLSSVSEICNSVAHPTNDDTARFLALTSNRSVVSLSGHLEEIGQVISSACTANADTKNLMICDMLSCPGDVDTLPPNSTGNSFLLEKANASPHNGFPSKSSCNSQGNLQAERGQKLDLVEHQTLEAGSVCSQDAEEGFLDHTSESASEKSSFSFFNERCEMSRSFDTCSNENHIRYCQLSLVTSSSGMKLLDIANHDEGKLTTYQAPTQRKLDCRVNNTELDGELTNHILEQLACSNAGNHVLEVEASTSNTELLSAKACKRSHISELHEDFQNKRPHVNGENQMGVAMNLRSTKSYLKESNSDPVVLLITARFEKQSNWVEVNSLDAYFSFLEALCLYQSWTQNSVSSYTDTSKVERSLQISIPSANLEVLSVESRTRYSPNNWNQNLSTTLQMPSLDRGPTSSALPYSSRMTSAVTAPHASTIKALDEIAMPSRQNKGRRVRESPRFFGRATILGVKYCGEYYSEAAPWAVFRQNQEFLQDSLVGSRAERPVREDQHEDDIRLDIERSGHSFQQHTVEV
ncbi:hypothetical protein Taro_015516 [Colocasia esculenta]|uniref:Uncharacterized protein n=1 Tax=Colocasia esculenta TaxID=4460 RepID=A0A843UBL7_COLES|nr:hypothetical protein [Colocasia esculenta]